MGNSKKLRTSRESLSRSPSPEPGKTGGRSGIDSGLGELSIAAASGKTDPSTKTLVRILQVVDEINRGRCG